MEAFVTDVTLPVANSTETTPIFPVLRSSSLAIVVLHPVKFPRKAQ
jgi:hypothetical protein